MFVHPDTRMVAMESYLGWSAVHPPHEVATPLEDERLQWSDLGKLARRTRRHIVGAARAGDRPTFHKLLQAHFEGAVEDLAVVEESWPSYDLVNVQLGLDAWLAEGDRSFELIGMVNFRHSDFGLSDLLRLPSVERYLPSPGNVSKVNQASGPDGQVTQCVQAGLYLVTSGEHRIAALLRTPEHEMGSSTVRLQVAADDTEQAAVVTRRIRELAVEHNVYRGQVISFGHDMFGERAAVLRFHRRPSVAAADVILPTETLAMVRRQAVGVAEHREKLLAARQHLKRGLLLYGPPGVGKTHTVRHLMSTLTGVTIIELSGEALGLISTACSVARTLQPAMIVVEDVDLIAEDRDFGPGYSTLLFQLLNEMDGLAEDSDVVFLLTTNRADLLEPALAARPGRVDQAVALELPDADARRRLFALYRGGLSVDESRLDEVIDRTDGVTASFLKELLRRAAVRSAAEGDSDIHVSADQLEHALDELMDTRNAMTRVLLGARRDGDGEDAPATAGLRQGRLIIGPGRYPG
jgi:ATPase family associated with various cellular activities (AAA)